MTYTCYAITAPGLEAVTYDELHTMGLDLVTSENGNVKEPDSGGVTFNASLLDIYRANLLVRTASRIIVRVGTFKAEGFEDLSKGVSKIPWEQYLSPGQSVSFRVTCHKSRLYHSAAVARETAKAIGVRMKKPVNNIPTVGEEDNPAQLILIRIAYDKCMISVDTSGELLHRRGYRLQTAKAPLRETLAAGILMGSGWKTSQPIIDPFCGSGTIPIEAALLASGIPSGGKRKFAFFDWPNYSTQQWKSLVAKENKNINTIISSIHASDRDEGAVEIASANAKRAGVLGLIQINHMAVSSIEPTSEKGWIITNPPYGVRVTSGRDLRDLYSRLGDVLRDKFSGWNYAILCSDPILFGHTRLSIERQMHLINGGIPVKLSIGLIS